MAFTEEKGRKQGNGISFPVVDFSLSFVILHSDETYIGDHWQSYEEGHNANKADENFFPITSTQLVGVSVHNCCDEAFHTNKLKLRE